METGDKKYRIFISAAEPSADVHCARLISSVSKINNKIEFIGVGGPKMASAGCKLLQTTTADAVMIYNAFGKIAHFYKLIRQIASYLKNNKVNLVIVCDSPSFNFHIAKAAKKNNIKTLFYVAPQLWAWAPWRISKLRRFCDKLCCILPFEQEWFSKRGVDSIFTGNPLLEDLKCSPEGSAKQYSDFEAKNFHIALMPGSRNAEIASLWQPMQKMALRLTQKFPLATFTAVAVDRDKQQILQKSQIDGFVCNYSIGSVVETCEQCDFAMVASGSATLQVAAAGCPMVVMYQSSKLLWYLVGRWLVKSKYLSLVNILACRELVPEFMPYFSSIEPIVQTIEQLLEDKDRLRQISRELIELTIPLRAENTSKKVAQIAIEMLA